MHVCHSDRKWSPASAGSPRFHQAIANRSRRAAGAGPGNQADRGPGTRPHSRPGPALADSYFPKELVRGTPLMLPEDVSAPGGVLASGGLIQARHRDEITVRMPTRAEIEKLSLPAAAPVAVHMRTGYDQNDRPLRVMITILPGDRHVIRYDVPAERCWPTGRHVRPTDAVLGTPVQTSPRPPE